MATGGGGSKKKKLRGLDRPPRGPSFNRRPMPIKRCEWCRQVIDRERGEKSAHFEIRRFCSRKCMAQFREFEKKVQIRTRGRVKFDSKEE